jgi:alanyl-tRNA synthetase
VVWRETGLPKERLLVSVHRDDRETANIWHGQEGVPLDRIVYKYTTRHDTHAAHSAVVGLSVMLCQR